MKSERILKLLQEKKGVSMPELQKITGWQTHTIRGFLSGTIKKKLGYEVVSERLSNGDRSYSIKSSVR